MYYTNKKSCPLDKTFSYWVSSIDTIQPILRPEDKRSENIVIFAVWKSDPKQFRRKLQHG